MVDLLSRIVDAFERKKSAAPVGTRILCSFPQSLESLPGGLQAFVV
jgi:hypothetical protein